MGVEAPDSSTANVIAASRGLFRREPWTRARLAAHPRVRLSIVLTTSLSSGDPYASANSRAVSTSENLRSSKSSSDRSPEAARRASSRGGRRRAERTICSQGGAVSMRRYRTSKTWLVDRYDESRRALAASTPLHEASSAKKASDRADLGTLPVGPLERRRRTRAVPNEGSTSRHAAIR